MRVNDLVATVSFVRKMKDGSEIGTASGFFYERSGVLHFVTNRHVVENHEPDMLRLRLHTDASDLTKNADYDVLLYEDGSQLWAAPPSYAEADVAVIRLDLKDVTKRHFVRSWGPQHLLPDRYMLHPGEDVFVVGYPLAFHDRHNNLPIFRNAMIASPFGVFFEGKPLFLTDANLHRGTSGSPVLTKPRDTWVGEDGSVEVGTQKPGSRYYLLGVHSGVFVPAKATDEPNLGIGMAWYAQLVDEAAASLSQA